MSINQSHPPIQVERSVGIEAVFAHRNLSERCTVYGASNLPPICVGTVLGEWCKQLPPCSTERCKVSSELSTVNGARDLPKLADRRRVSVAPRPAYWRSAT